jgi:hypothetical protein
LSSSSESRPPGKNRWHRQHAFERSRPRYIQCRNTKNQLGRSPKEEARRKPGFEPMVPVL